MPLNSLPTICIPEIPFIVFKMSLDPVWTPKMNSKILSVHLLLIGIISYKSWHHSKSYSLYCIETNIVFTRILDGYNDAKSQNIMHPLPGWMCALLYNGILQYSVFKFGHCIRVVETMSWQPYFVFLLLGTQRIYQHWRTLTKVKRQKRKNSEALYLYNC